jgi:hypothetical protein
LIQRALILCYKLINKFSVYPTIYVKMSFNVLIKISCVVRYR